MPQPRRKILKEYKLGFVVDDPFCPLVPELRAVYENVLSALRKAGVRLTEGWPEGFDLQRNYLTWAYLTVSGATSGTGVDKLVRGQRPPGKETYFEAARSAGTGTFGTRSSTISACASGRSGTTTSSVRMHSSCRPVSFRPSHGPELRDTNVLQTSVGPRCYGHLNVWPSVSGLSGNPSTTFPVGLTADGLPAGLEILGRHWKTAHPSILRTSSAMFLADCESRPSWPEARISRGNHLDDRAGRNP